jgi:hypothetical protein
LAINFKSKPFLPRRKAIEFPRFHFVPQACLCAVVKKNYIALPAFQPPSVPSKISPD